MARRVLVQHDGQRIDLTEAPAPSEQHLQEVLMQHPQLLPAEDLHLDGDLLVIGRETQLASGRIDLLCLAKSGDLILVEFKTGPQNPDFRHALAQLIDYGSDLWRMTVDDVDEGIIQRYRPAAAHSLIGQSAASLNGVISRPGWGLSDEEKSTLLRRLEEVLLTGDFHFVVAAQRFTKPMHASVDYLNATHQHGRFFLVEIVHLAGVDMLAYSAQVVAGPMKVSSGAKAAAAQTSEDEFLRGLDDDAYLESVRSILATCAALGLTVQWQSKGASIRLATPDRNEPLSVGWLLPDGAQWNGARHLCLGVDQSSLVTTPSVTTAVNTYVNTVNGIKGGHQTKSKLDARIFGPDVLPDAKAEITHALEQLIAATS